MQQLTKVFFSTITYIYLLSINPGSSVQVQPGKQANHGVARQELSLDPAVRKGVLSNGFTYYIRHNEEPKDRVIFYLANKAGSILEEDDQQGLAHFIEHMSFNGTKHYPKNELVDYLQKAGVRFGADLNAYTNYDETVYQLPLRSDDTAILRNGLQIIRDWAQDATLDPVEIDKERGVVLEEERSNKGAGQRMSTQSMPMKLNHSRYANRAPIGKDTVLNYFKPEAIRRFYHDWYRPDLQALIVVGDIDVTQMEKQIKGLFNNLKQPFPERKRPHYSIPLTGKDQFMVVPDKEMTATVIELGFKHTALQIRTRQNLRQALVRKLVNTMVANRFQELQRQAKPPFLSGGAGTGELLGGLDEFTIQVVARPGQLETGFKSAWRECARIRSAGFTKNELHRVKSDCETEINAILKDSKKKASSLYVEDYLQHFLYDRPALTAQVEYNIELSALRSFTLSDVNKYFNDQFSDINRDILINAPAAALSSLPGEKDILRWTKEVDHEKLQPYTDAANTLPLLTAEPKGGTIISEELDSVLNTTTIQLGNDVKVIIKPTDFESNQILFSGVTAGGTSLYGDSDFQSANEAARLVSAFGIGNYAPKELGNYLNQNQTELNVYMADRVQEINGSTRPEHFRQALALLYAYYTEPRKDSLLFTGIMAQMRDGMKDREKSPGSVFQDTVDNTLGNYNIRRTAPSLEKIDQISLDKAYNIYKERWGNAAGTTFTFVGNIDLNQSREAIAHYLGSLPSNGKATLPKDLGVHIPEGNIEKTVYAGSEAKANVYLVWSGPFEYTQKNATVMEALQEVLEIRLLQRLREDESSVYSPNVDVATGKLPRPRFSLRVSFSCAPGNADKLIASVVDEVEKLIKEGPRQENIDKWRAEALLNEQAMVKNNRWWLDYLSSQTLTYEDTHAFTRDGDIIRGIRTTDVQDLAGKYLDGRNFIRFVQLPAAARIQ